MPEVTVDLDDLTTIVFATAAIKGIEAALSQRKRDPFVTPHLDYTEAHNRLAAAMRNATRAAAGTLVEWNGELSPPELKLLQEVAEWEDNDPREKEGLYYFLHPQLKMPRGAAAMSVVDVLASRGCVQIGVIVDGVIWSGEDSAKIQPSSRGYYVRTTPRGREKLKAQNG